MRTMKRQLSGLLAAIMVFTCANSYAVQVKAEEKGLTEEKVSEQVVVPLEDTKLPSADGQPEEEKTAGAAEETVDITGKSEAGQTEDEKAEKEKTEISETLETQTGTKEVNGFVPYTKDDFEGIENLTFQKLSDTGKAKLKANNYVLEFPVLERPFDGEMKVVSNIGNRGFQKLKIKKVIFNDKIADIAVGAFSGNEITELELPDSITFVGANAFRNNKISKLTLSNNIQIMSVGVFAENQLQEVIIPDSVNEIFGGAFAGNPGKNGKMVLKVSDRSKIKFPDADNQEDVDKEFAFEPKKASSDWTAQDFTYGELKTVKQDNNKNTPSISLNLHAVTGFSEQGFEKLKENKILELPVADDNGVKVEAVGNMAFLGSLGVKRFDSLVIPEGYKAVGESAFMFNRCGGELQLPSTMEVVGMSAFFRNEFTSLVIPEKMTVIPLAMMRGNNLERITFNGQIETIHRLAFAENYLQEVTIPDSLKNIGPEAFKLNVGNPYYDDRVVLYTKGKNNPNRLEDAEDYVVDPKEETSEPIDYMKWEVADFTYQGQTITGFSQTGLRKIKRNKKLVLPKMTPDNKPLLTIGLDSFRGIDTKIGSPRDYNIETLVIPDTVQRIRNYAFQFNKLKEIKLPKELKKMGYGVFMNNHLTKIEFNDKLEYIDQACFTSNDNLGELTIPKSVTHIMNGAFRWTKLTKVTFEQGSKLEVIEAMAFAGNPLTKIELPEGIQKIGHQTFGNCQFTEITVPNSLKSLGFQTFINNPGKVEYGNAVVVHTKDKENPNNLFDDTGKTYVVDPETKSEVADKEELKKAVADAEKIDVNSLTANRKNNHRALFEEALKEAKEALEKENVSKWYIKAATRDLQWAVRRSPLSMLLLAKEKLDPDKAKYDKVKWKDLETTYKLAARKLMVIDLAEEYLQKLEYELELTLKNLKNEGNLNGAVLYYGEAKTPIPYNNIAPYVIKLKVWVKDGKIVLVHDNGTECDEPGEDHNIGYFSSALLLLNRFKNQDVSDVTNKTMKELGISAISGATISSHTMYKALKNALKQAPIVPPVNPNPQPEQPQPPVNPNPQPEQPKPPVNPNPEVMIPPSNGDLSSPGGTGSNSGSTLSNDTTKTETKIKEDKTPLANIPTETKALVLNNKKMVKPADKQFSDVIAGKYTHIELIVGVVSLKLMPKDVKALFKEGKGKSYLKVGKPGKEEIKKLNLKKKISEKDIFKPELMISGKKVTSFKKKISIKLDYKGVIKTDTVMILLADSNKMIKAKYNKESKTVEFKTNKLGTFVIMK